MTRKLAQGARKLVEGEVEAVNQKGETLISGTFVASLPSRSSRLPKNRGEGMATASSRHPPGSVDECGPPLMAEPENHL